MNNDTSYINIVFASQKNILKYNIDVPNKKYFYQKDKPLFKEFLDYHEWKKRKQLYDYYVEANNLFKTARDYEDKATTAAAQRPRVHEPAPGFPGIRDVFHRKEMISENFEIGTKFDHSALGIVSVGLTATVLYRYACIHLWIRNLGRYNPNGISNMNRGEMEGFLSGTQE
ncbi:unspecified product [Plasmodium ovale curtisi]|uniref:Unspecified product n=1 Tax=Plasmodium ovale curtisi TaxID=864141 RepID=A0A1A8WN02_PLAOA|nr:unspecified product [Plasmodium ovale curtisi]SBS99931.1 unspecified product [Plasmodium ovale curtisi]